jgi:tRNA(Ile)-lysidine synthase
MAVSTTPPIIEAGDAPPVVAVAYSGGRDSTALLHATARMAAAGEWGWGAKVLALHVHHGLSPQADQWWRHTQEQCLAWQAQGLPVIWAGSRLRGKPAKGESVEAWARQGRYVALARMVKDVGCNTVLLAHHRSDQAETFLLQALRGAGVAGLASMPACIEREGIHWLRPWLMRTSSEVQSYVDVHGLVHIEDDSNSDPRFARNKLRLKLWPLLTSEFSGAEASLAQTARHAADAQECLQDWLSHELAAITDGSVGGGGSLSLMAWQARTPAQQRMLLMAWVKRVSGQALPSGMVNLLQQEWQTSRRSGLCWPLPSGCELRLHRGQVTCVAPTRMRLSQAKAKAWPCGIRRSGRHVLPGDLGGVSVQRVSQGGVPLACLREAEWRVRSGGEQFQSGAGRPARSLKKQFQQAGVSAWARSGPLLWLGDRLLFVPGLGLDARVAELPGVPRVDLVWLEP